VFSIGSPAVRQPQPPFLGGTWPELLELEVEAPPVAEPPVPEPPAPLELDELDELDATHWLLEHVWLLGQVPQLSMPPQPSGAVPQTSPAGQVVAGVQEQWLALQVWGEVQFPPQVTVPPQPSGMVPQLVPEGHVLRGVQVTVTVTVASAPSASRAKTSVVPTTPPAVNAPVVSLIVEHLGGFDMSHVLSLPVYHFTGETPPVDVKAMAPNGVVMGVAGMIAKASGANESWIAGEVEGRCVASPPYIA
jgi:hypothetical protein